jgi:protein tyrosine phosphatase (PTP) superfamily phosphohydrolase (DUF442 family)
MKIEQLPEYSAEKYFILSELEQKCNLIYLNPDQETENSVEKTKLANSSSRAVMNFFYIVWSRSTLTEEQLQSQIIALIDLLENIMLGHLPKSSSSIILDILEKKETFYSAAFQKNLSKVAENLSTMTGIKFIIFGVTDNKGGSPGLEKCYDLIERILPGYVAVEKIANVVATDSATLLGHDAQHTPDAVSNVFQALCYNDEEENKFLLNIFEGNNSKIKQILKPADTTTSTSTQTQSQQQKEELQDYRFWIDALGCMVVAMAIYYFGLRKYFF